MATFTSKTDPDQVVEAVLYTTNKEGLAAVLRLLGNTPKVQIQGESIIFQERRILPGEWLVKGSKGEFFVWQPIHFRDCFEAMIDVG